MSAPASPRPEPTNRLAGETSPYLLQHQHNPVDWWPWGEAALGEARRTGKPILLSIGYAACHWCHVMAHESFEDPVVAAEMNRDFINIKVDREERPDIDQIYMSALHLLGEQGGWPLTMFLTPTAEPFWGGTYFPPTARWGKPSFRQVLAEVARLFREEPDKIEGNRRALMQRLSAEAASAPAALDPAILDRVAVGVANAFDPVWGGLKGAPKFPNPPFLELLWRAHDRTGEPLFRDRFLTTMRQMALGGIHDHLAGGFARYSVDAEWLVPHFEKMLYDNAQLLELYLLAEDLSPEPVFADAIDGIVTWLAREMRTDDGAFHASIDADSEGEEGRFYVWQPGEPEAVAGADADLLARLFDLPREGNWEGKLVLRRREGVLLDAADRPRWTALRARLLEHRARRVPPGHDDKVLADWNGLTVAALARTAMMRGDADALALPAYHFVHDRMRLDGVLRHAWRAGRFSGPALALDLAALARAAVALAEATGEPRYAGDARVLLDDLFARFQTGAGILAMTAEGTADTIVRPQPTHDEAVPNANGVAVEALVRLYHLTGDTDLIVRADALLAALGPAVMRAPAGHASVLNALDLRLRGASIAVAGATAADLAEAARRVAWPARTVVDLTRGGALAETHPAGAAVSGAAGGAAFVCVGDTCSLPIRDAGEIAARRAGLARRSRPGDVRGTT